MTVGGFPNGTREGEAAKPSVAVLTHIPSPYQVELFDAVAAEGSIALRVYYLLRSHQEREWASRTLRHEAVFLDQGMPGRLQARKEMGEAHLAVFNYYNHPTALGLMRRREATGLPWVFWGERPRLHAFSALSRAYRSWLLRGVRRSRVPVWGIGSMAVSAYLREFGPDRRFENVPYFSDLTRFASARRSQPRRTGRERIILFSGSLIRRKGIDLLASAFARLRRKGLAARLRVMGSGSLEADTRARLSECASSVDFVGFQDWDQLPAQYAQADVLCVPSRHDGWGLVVPEGLATGLPTISTTQMGAAVDLIRDRQNGWLVPPGSCSALYESLVEAVTLDRGQLDAMSEAAMASVAGHGLPDGVRRFVGACRSALGQSESGSR